MSTVARRPMKKRQQQQAAEEVKQVVENPAPRVRFIPADCSACTQIRRDRDDPKSYVRVVTTVGRVRYCKCGFCGHTFKQTEERVIKEIKEIE